MLPDSDVQLAAGCTRGSGGVAQAAANEKAKSYAAPERVAM
jgi:hypothetical protein